MSFPRYPKYKPSGVEWLGEVPEHWSAQPFKRQIERNDGGVWGDDPDGLNDTVVLRSTEQTVDGRWQIDDPARRKLNTSEIVSAMLITGDLLLTKSSGSSLHIGKTTLVTKEIASLGCCYSNFMQRIRTKASFTPALAWYVLNNNLARLQFDVLSNSTTGLANLNGTMIGQIIVPVAPLDEQLAIATFLDCETSKIDALVGEQRRLIELLKEKRQAVISHAVTKGLNPHAPMKPSGIEWLGDVPEHWEVRRIKTVSSFITSGPRGWSERIGDAGSLFVQSGDLNDRLEVEFEAVKRVQVDDDAESTRTRLQDGDVVVCVTGAKTGNVAVCHGIPEPSYVNQHLCLVRPTVDVLPLFLGVLLKSRLGQIYFEVSQYGLKQGLSLENVKNTPVIVPSVKEQLEIIAFLDTETTQLNALTAEAERAIELLQERRTALISAAVTGKIDVRSLDNVEVVA